MVIERFHLNENSFVLEIASNDGYLLQYFKEKNITVLGIEPASNVAEAAIKKGIPTLIKFFNTQTAKELASDGRMADLIIGNNVLAHVPDLNDFVNGLKMVLKPNGLITMEFPHLLRLIEDNQFDTIYHEHFSYFSFITVEKVFNKYGLTIFDVEEIPTHGGSLRIYVCHSDSPFEIAERVKELLNREEKIGMKDMAYYQSFSERVKKTKRDILKFLIELKERGCSIAAYGAPAKGNTLLNYCGIGTDFIEYTVDRNPHKQGMFLPGSRIPIYHPDRIKETRPDYLIILPWNLKEEIMAQCSYIREWGGKFVVLIPEIRVY
jgi:SAM-dependent methyltransferase